VGKRRLSSRQHSRQGGRFRSGGGEGNQGQERTSQVRDRGPSIELQGACLDSIGSQNLKGKAREFWKNGIPIFGGACRTNVTKGASKRENLNDSLEAIEDARPYLLIGKGRKEPCSREGPKTGPKATTERTKFAGGALREPLLERGPKPST